MHCGRSLQDKDLHAASAVIIPMLLPTPQAEADMAELEDKQLNMHLSGQQTPAAVVPTAHWLMQLRITPITMAACYGMS